MTTITRERLLKIQQWRETYGPGSNVVLPAEEAEELARIALASLAADSNNHPAPVPLSNDRLYRIRAILGKAAAQSDGGNIGYAMSDAVKAIDELLDVRKAEPIGITDRSEIECLKRGEMANVMPPDYKGVDAGDEVFVYTAPPAPAVPATLPCAVELKPGLIIGKGCKTEILLTSLKRRADYYAEIDAMTPEERAEHDANIEAFKAMLPQPVPDERKAFEAFMDNRFGDTIDQRRAKNGDQGYMAWDMVVAWIVWQGRAAMLNGGKS